MEKIRQKNLKNYKKMLKFSPKQYIIEIYNVGKDFNMATRSDFEERKRERERLARIRQQRNKKILTAVAACVVMIIAIAVIASCNSKNDNQDIVPENVNNNLTTTVAPTVLPVESNKSEGVAGIPDVNEENDLLEIVENSSAQKYAYLTFDDGPSEKITAKILDVLRRYDIKATFFQVGSYVKKLPDMTRRVHEEGHLVASHSYTHGYDKLYGAEEDFKEEVQDSYDLIAEVIDTDPLKLFRFPGGSYNSGDYGKVKQEYKGTLEEMGFYYVDWNALNGDAEGKTKNAAGLVEYFKKNMPDDGENLVILMHDSSSKQATVDSLDDIIDYLISEGYTFHRLDDIPYSSVAVGVENTPEAE